MSTLNKKEINSSKVGCSKASRAVTEGIVARINEHHEREIPEFIDNLMLHFGEIEGYLDCAKESGQLLEVTVHIVERSTAGTKKTKQMPVNVVKKSKTNPFSEPLSSEQNAQQADLKAHYKSVTDSAKGVSDIKTNTKSTPAELTVTELNPKPRPTDVKDKIPTLF